MATITASATSMASAMAAIAAPAHTTDAAATPATADAPPAATAAVMPARTTDVSLTAADVPSVTTEGTSTAQEVETTQETATQETPATPISAAASSDGRVTLGMRCELLSAGGSGSGLRASIKRYGEVAFIGAVRGLPAGEWFGVRLDKPLGKNDGSVGGVQYFACAPLHGAFVRREKLNTAGNFPVLATHAESIEHALGARRQALEEKKQLGRQQRALDREPRADELVQSFWQRFTAHERDVRRQLGVFVEQRQQPTLCDPAHAVQLDALVLRIGEMRDDAAAAASMYLSAYDIRQSQIIVTKLLELIETTRAAFAPRKKFAFRARAKRVGGAPAPVAVGEGENGGVRSASISPSGIGASTGTGDIKSVGTSSSDTPTPEEQSTMHDKNNQTSSQSPSQHDQQQTPTPPGQNQQPQSQSHRQQQQQQQASSADLDELVHADLQNQIIVIDEHSFAADPSKRRDLSFSRLRDCIVFVCVDTSAIRCDDLQRCVVLAGPVWGSVWLERCDACEFVVACRQLRVHQSTATSFHLRMGSHPIIEGCERLQFGPYRLRYAGLDDQLERIGLLRDNGLWARVNDFQWHRAQQSPNWRVRDPAQPLPTVPAALAGRVSLY